MHRFQRNKISRYFPISISAFVLSSLLLAPLHAQNTPPKSPQLTPFQLNAFLFKDVDDAFVALSSPDILMRRSAVECLARMTGNEMGLSLECSSEIKAQLADHPILVPSLIHAVQDMPLQDSEQAARLLALIPGKARPAIPSICSALSLKSGLYDFNDRADYLNSLLHICGALANITPTLLELLKDKEPETRRSAAEALRYCRDATFSRFAPSSGSYQSMSPDDDVKWVRQFHDIAIPALTNCLNDRVPQVQIAAAHSLEGLTYDSEQAPWNLTVEPLAHMLLSKDPIVRLAALKTLAVEPGDISAAAHALRGPLSNEDQERGYALAALCHAVTLNQLATLNVFLPELSSKNIEKRRRAAADIRAAAAILWQGSSWPDPPPLPNWVNDQRLFLVSRALPEADLVHTRLLSALVTACGDHDESVSKESAEALKKIGECEDAKLSIGIPIIATKLPPRRDTTADVMKALDQARDTLQANHPDLAKLLSDMKQKMMTPRPIL